MAAAERSADKIYEFSEIILQTVQWVFFPRSQMKNLNDIRRHMEDNGLAIHIASLLPQDPLEKIVQIYKTNTRTAM